MATIELRYPHRLALEDAAHRCRVAVDRFNTDHPSYVITWDSDGLRAGAKGMGFAGEFTVSATEIQANIDLSWALRPFKGKVEGSLRRRLDDQFGGPA